MLLGGTEECHANISQYIWHEFRRNKSEIREYEGDVLDFQ